MLELPEVITIRDQMRQVLVAKRIEEMSVIDRGSLEGTIRSSLVTQSKAEIRKRVVGASIRKISNHLGGLFIGLDNGNVIYLGDIYGNIRYHTSPETLPKKSSLHLGFSDGAQLTVTITFFGVIRAFTAAEADAQLNQEHERDALDPSSDDFTWKQFSESIHTWGPEVAKLSAKKFVTSCYPTYIGGIGNGCLQEILYRGGIHPRRKMSTLATDEIKSYHKAIRSVVREATRKGGRENELDLYGKRGRFVSSVSKDTLGKPCPTCGGIIAKFAFEGGACYICPGCQQPG